MERLLSICIPLHNRTEEAIKHIENLLKSNDGRFDIVVSDTSEEGKDLRSIWGWSSDKVKIYRFDSSTPPEENWKMALNCADGTFALHMNDRDIILETVLSEFLDFLESHDSYSGGICKYMPDCKEPMLFKNKEEAMMNIPYFASHPTGLIFNMEYYKEIEDLDFIFSRKNGIHPHDILLGRLSQRGKMFIYTQNVWKYASPEFYKRNLSGVSTKKTGLFFEPKERLFEFKRTLEDFKKLDFSDDIKKQKTDQMIKTYLGLSTNAYFYVLESDHETAHYGIEKEKFNPVKRYSFSTKVFDMFDKELRFSKKQKKKYKKWLLKTMMIPVIAKYTSKINNPKFRSFLRKLRMKRDADDSAVLR